MQQNSWITRSIGVLVAIAATAFATGSAPADGYQSRGVAPLAGCANFGGFYVGGNIGWATLNAHQNDLDGYFNSGFAPASFFASDDTFTAGAQVGYNLQKGCTVFGIEADWNWADLNADTRIFPGTVGVTDSLRTRIENFGTIRTRTGVVVDQLLLYVTGGLAWAETRDSVRGVWRSGRAVLVERYPLGLDRRIRYGVRARTRGQPHVRCTVSEF
jgi:outer membrane immunogenic protein